MDLVTQHVEIRTTDQTHSKWRHEHPRYTHNKADPYHLLTRREQVTVFRLRTGHNHLIYHLCSKLCINHTKQCPCGTGSQTTEHLMQSCPLYKPFRKGIWPNHTPVARKVYGSSMVAWGTCDALPPSSRRLEFLYDEREEEETHDLMSQYSSTGAPSPCTNL